MDTTIIIDSTCDLTNKIIEKNNIKVLPLYVNFKEESFLDGVDLTTHELFEKVKVKKELPKTAAISPARFFEAFKEELDKGNEVVYLGIGSGFSTSYSNAVVAAEELDSSKIHIIDSMNLSSGTGLLVLKAIKFRKLGYDGAKIKEEVEKLRPLVKTQFAINTLEYLHKGGRCSGTSRLFGTLLSVKPIIRVVDGQMVVAQKPRGKYHAALERILDYVKKDISNIDHDYLLITHSAGDEDAIYLKNRLNEIMPQVDVILETKAGCVIASHCGPRTIGILYMVKK